MAAAALPAPHDVDLTSTACDDDGGGGSGESSSSSSAGSRKRKRVDWNVKKHTARLRIAASDVAAVCGMHPHQSSRAAVVERSIQYLYQDLHGLLRHDAELLSMTVVTKQQASAELLSKAGSEAAAALSRVVSSVAETSSKAAVGAEQVAAIVGAAAASGKLTRSEAAELRNGLTSEVFTLFGRRAESGALLEYHAASGNDVFESNERMLRLGVREGTGGAFFVVGFVDGFAHAPCIGADGELTTTKIVVEMKNRVRRLYNPPPFYDQIQLVMYLAMTGLQEGDLVQRLGGSSSSSSSSSSSGGAAQLSIHRVAMRGIHEKGLRDSILPRLKTYADWCYALRRDDGARYAFLAGTPAEKFSSIASYCTFLL